jgi:hypothetical protein
MTALMWSPRRPLRKFAAQVAVGLAMSDDGFDGGPSPQLLLDLAMDAALLAGFEDPPRVGSVVPR